jgi:hypothetical protein
MIVAICYDGFRMQMKKQEYSVPTSAGDEN